MNRIWVVGLLIVAAGLAVHHLTDADRAASAAHLACEAKEKERVAISMAQSAMKDSQLCLDGIRTDRFDPDVDCGEGQTKNDWIRFYLNLQKDIRYINLNCPEG